MKRPVLRQSTTHNIPHTRGISPIRLISAAIMVCMVMGLSVGSIAPAQNTAAHNTSSPQNEGVWLNEKLYLDSPSLLEQFHVYRGNDPDKETGTSDDEAFERAVQDAFGRATSSFTGAGTRMNAHDIRTFDLVTDRDLADPSHMGRDKGVKVTILYDSSVDPAENSLWSHEADATAVAQALYAGDAGARIGTLSIVFKHDDEEGYGLKLILDAADAERFAGSWQDGSFIRRADWSEVDINADDIAPYEHPGRSLAPSDAGQTGAGFTQGTVASNREALQKELYASTILLTSSSTDVAISAEAEQFDRTAALADGLIGTSDAIREHVENLHIDPDLEPARQEYLLGVDEYRKAGCYIWNGARHTSSDEFGSAEAHLKAGEDHINTALGMLDMEQLDSRSYTRPPCDPFPEALALGEHFTYRDDQGANDISVIVDNYETRTGYSIEEDGTFKRVNAEYGNKFLYVVLHATHLGFRGNGSEEITTPPADAFTLILGGEEYAHSTPEHYVKELGCPYSATTIERKEVHEGFLIFPIPETADPATAYIKFDQGGGEQPVWKLRA
jgi:hypothetical protein